MTRKEIVTRVIGLMSGPSTDNSAMEVEMLLIKWEVEIRIDQLNKDHDMAIDLIKKELQ